MVTLENRQKNIFFSGDKSLNFQLLASDSQSLIDGFRSSAIFLGLKLSKSSIAFSAIMVVVNVKAYILEYTFVLMGKAY